jgi:hypothetical protein
VRSHEVIVSEKQARWLLFDSAFGRTRLAVVALTTCAEQKGLGNEVARDFGRQRLVVQYVLINDS